MSALCAGVWVWVGLRVLVWGEGGDWLPVWPARQCMRGFDCARMCKFRRISVCASVFAILCACVSAYNLSLFACACVRECVTVCGAKAHHKSYSHLIKGIHTALMLLSYNPTRTYARIYSHSHAHTNSHILSFTHIHTHTYTHTTIIHTHTVRLLPLMKTALKRRAKVGIC